jgi:hypothetical protein
MNNLVLLMCETISVETHLWHLLANSIILMSWSFCSAMELTSTPKTRYAIDC